MQRKRLRRWQHPEGLPLSVTPMAVPCASAGQDVSTSSSSPSSQVGNSGCTRSPALSDPITVTVLLLTLLLS